MVRRLSTISYEPEGCSDCSTEPKQIQGCDEQNAEVTSKLLDPFGEAGIVLSRTTTSSKLFRTWQSNYWVHLLPATLLVFKSEQDFHNWKEERGGDYPSGGRTSRNLLLDVDFDTLGILSGPGEVQRGVNKNSRLPSNAKAVSPKLVSRVQKHSLGDVESCFLKGQVLFMFKLERISHVGVDSLASFASADAAELRKLRRVIHDCIRITTRTKKRRSTRQGEDETLAISTVEVSEKATPQTRRRSLPALTKGPRTREKQRSVQSFGGLRAVT